ncbi:MAG: T9SS type A sorting domain-containing protein [Bacteroidia bacterium]|nr:T9SS type A sorting domain-containing protein [Bacteroidia bacterium]
MPNGTILPMTPSAIETNTTLLNDMVNWKQVNLQYTATGNEQYLTIGRPIGTSSLYVAPSTVCGQGFYFGWQTAYLYIDKVSVVPILTVSAVASNTQICAGSSTLTASSSNGATTFTWMPGNFTGSSLVVTPTISTTYTLLGSVPGCAGVASTTVQVNYFPQSISTIPSSTICANYSTTLTANASIGPATFTWMPGSIFGSTIVVTPTATTVYTVTGTASNGCTATTTVQVTIYNPPGSFAVSGTPTLICLNQGQSTTTLTASGTHGLSYTWTPSGNVGASQTFTPAITTVYTVTALSGGCIVTNTFAVAVQSNCCTSTITAYAGLTFPTNTVGTLYNTPLVFNNDVTIPAGSVVNLSNAQFLFAPNVKIIVSNGSKLLLQTAHLYACGTSMWQGIVVQDGGKVVSTKENLIEDAIIAMDVSANTTSTVNPILQVYNTVFNKNYISIKIDGFQKNSANYPFAISANVFSSRNFTFTPTAWPYANLTILRAATNPTTGLAVPYLLQSAAIVNLKAPYTNQSARIGVQIINSGITSGSNYYGVEIGSVGGTQPHDDFNLFDALLFGIDATNSNVSSINNVYQNSQRVYFCPKCYYAGGTAIKSEVNSNLNAKLNLTTSGTYSTSYGVGNRFWNCHRAVEAINVYRLDCNYATFRSTQTTTAATSALLLPGAYGITNATNRFEHNIRYNKFNNINNAVAITVAPGTYTYGANTYNGILANNILIDYNYFGAQLTNGTAIGTAFLNNAVYLGSTSNAGWNSIAGIGLRVANNEVNRAWRGVYVDAFGYPTSILTNTVTLLNDATIAATQKGISASGNISAVTTIANNKLTGVNTTNTLVTLVYVGASPVSGVTCNTLNTSYQGFEFNSSSNGSTWKGNDMSNHARGMILSNNGIIGTQGNSGAPSDNRWWGSWTGANGTYVDGASDAVNSKLWIQNAGVWIPPTPGGPVFGLTYGVVANTPTTTGTYVCGSIPPPSMMAQSSSSSSSPSMLSANAANASAEEQYVADNTTYRYLDANPSVKNSNTTYVNFYNSKANSSMDKFKQVEANLYNGQISQAQSINNAVSAINGVESNYKNYYAVLAKYKNGSFTSADSATLINLAKLCPGIDGSIVYQARALYNLIYKTIKVYKEDCNTNLSSGSRLTNASVKETIKNNWNVELFPNPTKGNFTLVSKAESDALTVTITDIAGKLIYSNTVNTSNFIVNLDVNTKAGVYLITIKNSTNESITKKLVIAD